MNPLPPRPWRKPNPLPDPVARTQRLVVRPYRAEDAEALFEAVDSSRGALLPWLPWARDGNRSVAICRDLIHAFRERTAYVEADDFVLAIFDHRRDELVGGTGFHRIDLDHGTGEIGYWIRASRRREGLCREAVAALITAGFRDWAFRRLKVCCAAANLGSLAVIERLGLRLEARERDERYVDGVGWCDSLTFAVLADEWDADAERGPGGTSL